MIPQSLWRALSAVCARSSPSDGIVRTMRTPRAWFVGLFLLFAALAHAAAGNPRIEALRMRIETLRTEGDAHIGAGSPTARALLAAVYEPRGFAPLWTDARRVGALRNAIDASTTHGLEPRDYHAGTLPPSLPAAHSPDHFRAAEQDLLLTEAFMRFAYHLRFGKSDPRTLQASWNFARTLKGVDPVAALSNLLTAPDPAAALEGLAPGLPMYGKLRRALCSFARIFTSATTGSLRRSARLFGSRRSIQSTERPKEFRSDVWHATANSGQ